MHRVSRAAGRHRPVSTIRAIPRSDGARGGAHAGDRYYSSESCEWRWRSWADSRNESMVLRGAEILRTRR
ncbi:hypothetical protein SAMN04487905_1238 [Actinopolyspora xinjiangensis]|uniref:Uncharacterized protein n=1 Tax=Actinopolyspora xinjiangensis TaxID=405564 RepID=A0A1H0X248_9ACTN|nr:hypothetical protein SAMN04487905_1238 [Actinopolyspora xinjiangensis]